MYVFMHVCTCEHVYKCVDECVHMHYVLTPALNFLCFGFWWQELMLVPAPVKLLSPHLPCTFLGSASV